MSWKDILQKLEQQKEWDAAIVFMQKVIKQEPEDKDAWIFMNYLLINLLCEEDYDRSKRDYYWTLAKWYFNESYAKYSDDPEYLYITGKSAVMGEWFFGIDQKDYEAMLEKARALDPNNLTYKEDYYWKLLKRNPNDPELIAYAHLILSESSPVTEQLKDKGAVGEYLLGMKRHWCERVLRNAAK